MTTTLEDIKAAYPKPCGYIDKPARDYRNLDHETRFWAGKHYVLLRFNKVMLEYEVSRKTFFEGDGTHYIEETWWFNHLSDARRVAKLTEKGQKVPPPDRLSSSRSNRHFDEYNVVGKAQWLLESRLNELPSWEEEESNAIANELERRENSYYYL